MRQQAQQFATSLLDHARTSYELEIMLNYNPTGENWDPGERQTLDRLKLAIKYKQKQVRRLGHSPYGGEYVLLYVLLIFNKPRVSYNEADNMLTLRLSRYGIMFVLVFGLEPRLFPIFRKHFSSLYQKGGDRNLILT